ncbi:MAG: rhodanese-like domain-containing protein [Anaerolineales bacterium]|nr:rhodanese-like domain-containing protein [Anaerolineales bacterium]
MAKSKTQRSTAAPMSVPWLWIGVAVIVLAVGAWYFLQQNQAGGYPREISVAEAANKRDAGVFILDVRQPEEWNEYHVPNTTLIPLGELNARLSELPRDQEIVIVCRSGNRSGQARDILRAAGFTQVTSMAGGLVQWRAAGYQTVSGP